MLTINRQYFLFLILLYSTLLIIVPLWSKIGENNTVQSIFSNDLYRLKNIYVSVMHRVVRSCCLMIFFTFLHVQHYLANKP